MKKRTIYVYYHNDLDGLVSVKLAFRVLESLGYEPKLGKCLNYSSKLKKKWQKKKFPLKKPACVLDYQYHPDVEVWFDHHPKDFSISENTKFWAFDKNAKSCAKVIYDFAAKKGIKFDIDNLDKILRWTDIIDSGLFAENDIPASETINPSLEITKLIRIMDLKRKLIPKLTELYLKGVSFKDILELKEVKNALEYNDKKREEAKKIFEANNNFDAKNGVVTYEVLKGEWFRFMPQLYFSDSLIWLGIIKKEKDYVVSLTQNPWNSQPNLLLKKDIHFGNIAAKYGGGGHWYVAVAEFKKYKDAKKAFSEILETIKNKLSQENSVVEKKQI